MAKKRTRFRPTYRSWSVGCSSSDWNTTYVSHMHGWPSGHVRTQKFRVLDGKCPECGVDAPTVSEWYAAN